MRGLLVVAILPIVSTLAGCETHHTIEVTQPKPLEINIHFTGQLDLVIQDARQNLEQITGEKPKNVVRPEDIGLPAATAPGGAMAPVHAEPESEVMVPVAFIQPRASMKPLMIQVVAQEDLKKAMAERNAKIRELWNAKAVGESHTGLLVVKGTLTDDQKKLVDDENRDRQAFYAAEAKSKGTSVEQVATGYYVARLAYANAGNWYEKLNSAKQWEWKQWGEK